jgi:hypothetical protein
LAGRGAVDLEQIAWRMSDASACDRILAALEERWVFPQTSSEASALWQYCLRHFDGGETASRRVSLFLSGKPLTKKLTAPCLDLPGFFGPTVQAQDRGEHLEYAPLVNARAHQLGPERQIMNAQLSARYKQFVSDLAFEPSPHSFGRKLATCYYWLALDRVRDAAKLFGELPEPSPPAAAIPSEAAQQCRIQWAYMRCYMNFLSGSEDDLTAAAELAQGYVDHPIAHWRRKFVEVVEHVRQAREAYGGAEEQDAASKQEAAGGLSLDAVGDAALRREKDLAAASRGSPSLEAALEAGASGAVTISHANVDALRVNYYRMDIEFMFSTNPFVGGGSASAAQFSFVRPNHTVAVPREDAVVLGDRCETRVVAPEAVGDEDHIAEVTGSGGVRSVVPVFRSKMSVQITETTGRLRVTLAGKPAVAAYVKVYSRTSEHGKGTFYKDGYTDIRGCFDYVTLDTDALSSVQRFAILLSSRDSGALIREAAPPATAARRYVVGNRHVEHDDMEEVE